jgi:hypothetical protein
VTVADRWEPTKPGVHGTGMARRGVRTCSLLAPTPDLACRVRPVQGDHLPRWQAAKAARQRPNGLNRIDYLDGLKRVSEMPTCCAALSKS